jgi:DNA topoisomerase IB
MIVSAIKQVAARLRNRPATRRNYYVHPAILESWQPGETTDQKGNKSRRSTRKKSAWSR